MLRNKFSHINFYNNKINLSFIKAIKECFKMKEIVMRLMTEIEKEYHIFGYNLQDEENLKQFNKDVTYTLEHDD